MKKAVETPAAPSAIGPYSQAVVVGDLIFCSGQIGIDPSSGKMVEGGIEAETRRVLENLREVLTAAGLTLAHVVKTIVFLINLTDFETVNRIYLSGAIDGSGFSLAASCACRNRGDRAPLTVLAVQPVKRAHLPRCRLRSRVRRRDAIVVQRA